MSEITKITFYGKDFSPLKKAEYSLGGPKQKQPIDGPHLALLWFFCDSFKNIRLFNRYSEYFDRNVGVFRNKKFRNPFDQKYYDVTLEISCRFDQDKKAYFLAAMLLCLNPEDLKQIPDRANITFHQVMDIFLLFMYKKQLAEAAKKGIFRKYQRFENNDSRPHGTIDIACHIRENMGLESGNIAYHYRELTANNSVNRLILAAYKRLCEKHPTFCENRIKNDERVYPTLKMLQMELGYSKTNVRNIVKENLRPVTHPYFSEYEDLRKTCLKILRDENVWIFGAEDCTDETESLYVNVTELWEKFLEYRFDKQLEELKKKPEYSGLELKPQEERPIFVGRDRNNPGARPDFLFQKGTENLAILDAKFKPRWKGVVSEDTSGDDQTDADINKCIRDMEVFQAPRTGVIFPVEEKDIKDLLRNGKMYHIDYHIGVDSGPAFDMVRVCVPNVPKGEEKRFEDWYHKLLESVDGVLKLYLTKITET